MKNKLYLIAPSTFERGMFFFKENIEPLVPCLKKRNSNEYYCKCENYRIKIVSLSNPNSLRGYRADLVFLDNDCPINIYTDIILPMVNYEHDRIKVVM